MPLPSEHVRLTVLAPTITQPTEFMASIPPETDCLKRGMLRLCVVLWLLWSTYWVLVWPLRISAQYQITLWDVYADAFQSSETLLLLLLWAAVFLVAIPFGVAVVAWLGFVAFRWVLRGFRGNL
jgi:hypothetical protein